MKLERDVLSISVEQLNDDQQQGRNYAKREYSYNSFVRSFTLPESADQGGIEAKYADGVLCIDILQLALYIILFSKIHNSLLQPIHLFYWHIPTPVSISLPKMG